MIALFEVMMLILILLGPLALLIMFPNIPVLLFVGVWYLGWMLAMEESV